MKRGRLPSTGYKPTIQAQIDAAFLKQARQNPDSLIPPEKLRKYRNTPTDYASSQGFSRKYDSIKEARYAEGLDAQVSAQLIRFWLPQVPFPLPGGVTYRLDFLIFERDGTLRFVDVKGRDTPMSDMKRKQVRAIYGVDVELA